MKYFTFILVFLCIWVSLDCFAKSNLSDIRLDDTFEITFVNAPKHQIKIGGIAKHKNETFRVDSKITWLNAGDYIKAKNLRTGQRYKVSGASFKRFGSNDLANYIHKRYTGTKGSRETDALTMEGEYLSQFPWELIDGEVEIPVNLPVDDDNFYVIKSIPGNDETIIAEIDSEESCIYISQKQLCDIGIKPENIHNYTFIVRYVHDKEYKTLTDKLTIEYLPTINYTEE